MGKVSSIGTTSKEGSGEDPFRVSEANLAGEASRLLRAAISPNTTSAYSTGLNAFEHFRIKANISNIWPPPQDHIVNFIAHLSLNGYAESTARNYIAAIGYQCKINGYLNTTNSFIVSKLLDGLRRLKGKADSRLPITEQILGRIVGALCNICSNTYESKLFTAAYTLAFFAFLRVGEIVLSKGNDSHSILGINDVRLDNNQLTITIKSSKTDQLGKGTTIVLNSYDSCICPVKCMLSFLQIRPKLSGPLFCHYGGKPLTRYQFAAVLDKAIAAIGLDKNFYKSHSFRIGAATTAFQRGLSDEEIKIAGRWKSSVFQTYIRSPLTQFSPLR